MRRLAVAMVFFAFPLVASAEEVARKTFELLGKKVAVKISTDDRKTFSIEAGHLFTCRATAYKNGAQALVFNECTNGWVYYSGEFMGKVVVSMSGSKVQEVVTDDSVHAWCYRTVIKHHSSH